jgi:hypothetical protein
MLRGSMNENETKSAKPVLEYEPPRRVAWSFFDYFWFVFKNVLGWIFILGSFPVGLTVPGPGGVPLFLIGFALVTFPGKRKITSHVMRGRPMQVDPGIFTLIATIASIIVTAAILMLMVGRYQDILQQMHVSFLGVFGVCALAAGITWLIMRVLVSIVNWVLRRMPRVRKFIRPFLRKYGINLLPPRRHLNRISGAVTHTDENEILNFSDNYKIRFKASWTFLKPWLKRVVGLTITVFIFIWMFRPVMRNEDQFRHVIEDTNKWVFFGTAVMFAIFLFAFRAMSWRRILAGLGHPLPIAPVTRIWSTSELARYVPGSVLQFVGRVYLIKPYGVGGSLCSTSQILELVIFLLSNILVAVLSLTYFGWRHMDGLARMWLLIVIGLVPLLIFFLNPKVFYPLVNRTLARFKKQSITTRLRRRDLSALTGWNVLGLLWQCFAVWLITRDILPVPLTKWWVVAGSYCLAWCAGFLAFWAPGGFGVREFVFVTAMHFALPDSVRSSLGPATSKEALSGVLAILAVLLRLWTIAGELMVASLAYLFDYKGAMDRPDAPGRV